MAKGGIQTLFFLLFFQKTVSGTNVETKVLKNQESVNIQCTTGRSTVFWFRVLDNTGIEFIATFRNRDRLQSSSSFTSIFSTEKTENVLQLMSFNKEHEGFYSCASLNSNELNFGKVTRLVGQDPPKATPATTTCKNVIESQTTTACACKTNTKIVTVSPFMLCDPMILGPLAGGCGLLLLLLIITICYCNRIRTRRCPHHYKRQPRMRAPEDQQLKLNRHV